MRRKRFLAPALLAAFSLSFTPARSVILYGTADPAANTTAPTGTLAGSGWQYEGQFGTFLGTVIASNYFVTAKHIGGSVGDIFIFDGVNYTTTAVFPDPSSDLQIWRVAASFPLHAPLFSGPAGSEVNLALVVIGRGTQRGNPVLVGTDSHLGGWLWGTPDAVQRWGTNVVGSIYSDPSYGNLLRVPFDAGADANEAHLSSGDSGGAVFVLNTTTNNWELAGINLAVDGPFSTSSSGANAFNAAMFDTTGLWVPGGHAPNPSNFYATEIAAHRGFVESVVMQLVSVVSQKSHGNAGTFNINLPVTGLPGIECRSGGATTGYTLVFTFTNNVSVQGATLTAGTGSADNFTVVANQVTVNLSGIESGQTIELTLINVSDGVNSSDVQATMRVLPGDTNGDSFVDSADISQTKSQSGQAVTGSNFREDTNVDGFLDSADIGFVKSKSGMSIPATQTQIDNLNVDSNLHIEPLATVQPDRSRRSRFLPPRVRQ